MKQPMLILEVVTQSTELYSRVLQFFVSNVALLESWQALHYSVHHLAVIYFAVWCSIWQYRFSSFQAGYTKLKRCFYKFLRIGLMGRWQKVTKFDFLSQFSMSKIIQIFLIFFSLKNINLKANFLFPTFFDNINS